MKVSAAPAAWYSKRVTEGGKKKELYKQKNTKEYKNADKMIGFVVTL